MQHITAWRALLDSVNAVVKVAGILREKRQQIFDAIHHDGPLALARACAEHGVRDFVQVEVGCAQPVSLRDYLMRWRAWLQIPGVCALPTPLWAVDAAVAVGERFGADPMGQTLWRMLKRGKVCSPVTPAAQIEAIAADRLLAELRRVAVAGLTGGVDLLLARWLGRGWCVSEAVASTLRLVPGDTLVFGGRVPGFGSSPDVTRTGAGAFRRMGPKRARIWIHTAATTELKALP